MVAIVAHRISVTNSPQGGSVSEGAADEPAVSEAPAKTPQHKKHLTLTAQSAKCSERHIVFSAHVQSKSLQSMRDCHSGQV